MDEKKWEISISSQILSDNIIAVHLFSIRAEKKEAMSFN